MSATPFMALSWEPHEVLTKNKFDRIQSNHQWISDNSPRGRLLVDENPLDSDLILVAGRAFVPRSKYSYRGITIVYFGSAFKPGTTPTVTTGIVSDQKRQVFCVTNGIGTQDMPDHIGFNIQIEITTLSERPRRVKGRTQRDKPDRNVYVFWQALGQRSAS